MVRQCPAISNISFDQDSLDAIAEIQEIHDLKKYGRIAVFLGHFLTIFGGVGLKGASGSGALRLENKMLFKLGASDANQASWNLTQVNWEYFLMSFQGLDRLALQQIEKIAYRQAHLHISKSKEYQFWRSIYLGCTPNVK
ncbi:hypothetical protein [Photobacterium marinum]|uniref:hypothetical protein n=1 Tax=Photobacterium marinum TaxID=1056511 RepID=UPI000561E79B|nr:hypothetical protein [Photobacterium marinum]